MQPAVCSQKTHKLVMKMRASVSRQSLVEERTEFLGGAGRRKGQENKTL